MEPFLNPTTLKEIFFDTHPSGPFQDYSDQIQHLHHRFLENQLSSDRNVEDISVEELLNFAEDAEYLATHYTNPLVVERIDGLPIENVPSRQIVQDALSLSGTIFEFLADLAFLYEQNNNDKSSLDISDESYENEDNLSTGKIKLSEIHEVLGNSSILYLKSALCYGLGMFESRTMVIINRLFSKITQPELPLSFENCRRWSEYLILALLSRNLHQIVVLRENLGEQSSHLQSLLRRALQFADNSTKMSPNQIAEFSSDFFIIDAIEDSANAFLNGDPDLNIRALSNLLSAARSAYKTSDYQREWTLRTLRKVISKMWNDSPWVRLSGVIDNKRYIKKLIQDGIITFWTSQITALEIRSKISDLNGGYLDERIKRVIINMPTSAGKTLLAELALVSQTIRNKGNICVYVAPSRALCDQIASDFNTRLSRFNIRITSIVSDYDLTGYEDLLFQQSNVIVVTPEKLGYLIRQKTTRIFETSLFIFDELHTISREKDDWERGWNYEELITLLLFHEETKKAKMLFMSAIMPNSIKIQEWVDPEKKTDVISETWQPTRLLKGVITFNTLPKAPPPKSEIRLNGDLVYVRRTDDLSSPLRIKNVISSKQIAYVIKDSDNEINHAVSAAAKFSRLGPVLVYCPTKNDAVKFVQLAEESSIQFPPLNSENERYLSEVIEYVEDRLPERHPLINALKHRIAFHNSSLPQDVRNEIENSFKRRLLQVLAATTTLVEGVNLPVKTLVFSDYVQRDFDSNNRVYKGRHPLSVKNYRNIAGRAGRALYETEGQVIFIQSLKSTTPTVAAYRGPYDVDFLKYLDLDYQSSELNITSSLANPDLLADLSGLIDQVDNGFISSQDFLFNQENIKFQNNTSRAILEKLQVFTLLINEQLHVDDNEEAFVNIFQNTLLGKQLPQSSQTIGATSYRSYQALQAQLGSYLSIFSQTGLKVSTCYSLLEKVKDFWLTKRNSNFNEFLSTSLSSNKVVLKEIAALIYSLNDNAVKPEGVKETKSSRKKISPQNETDLFADWILLEDDKEIANYFSFIKDQTWRAEQILSYMQSNFEYRIPWVLSSFWLFSQYILASTYETDLVKTPLGRELILLPAYAKFGVNSPAAALFSTLGINPRSLARKLAGLYQEQTKLNGTFDYLSILKWLLTIEPKDLEESGKIKPSYIRRLTRLLTNLKPLDYDQLVRDSERRWEAIFPIKGWQYYNGPESLFRLNIGMKLTLVPEPDNPNDPKAILIFTEWKDKLGYVPRYLNSELLERITPSNNTVTINKIEPNANDFDVIFVQFTQNL